MTLLEIAVAAARAAGGHALANRTRRMETDQVSAHDVKLKLDRECQAIAENSIRERQPKHAILGEETADGTSSPADSSYLWIIDPIDGTVNFSHGLPFWCCSVAVRFHGNTIAGAVYAPQFDELYTAAVGQRSECNGHPLQVSGRVRLSQSLVMTGLDQKVGPTLERYEIFRAIADSAQKARVMGVAALDMCRVASGQAEGYFEAGIYTWDIAAASLIVEQAGGLTETIAEAGGHRLLFLATNGHIHGELRDLICAHLK